MSKKVISLFFSSLIIVLSLLTPRPASAATLRDIKTVFVIVVESHGLGDFKGYSGAPYVNSLLAQAAYATNYLAPPGVVNLSLPQYIWIEAGDNLGIANDGSPAKNPLTTTDHLSAALDKAGVSWKGYFEDIPGTTCPVTDVNKYAVRHDPFVYFPDVKGNTAFCQSHIRPYSELSGNLSSNSVAKYNFIVPNLCNDGHDTCSPISNQVTQIDTWLKNNVPTILNSQAYKNNGALFITVDNDDSSLKNPLLMIVLSPLAKGNGYTSAILYNHGSLLRTVEDIFGIQPYIRASASMPSLVDLFNLSGVVITPTPAGKTGDINSDGKVDIVDIGIAIDNYGKSPIPNPKADINKDGVVNIIDIGIIIDNYGK